MRQGDAGIGVRQLQRNVQGTGGVSLLALQFAMAAGAETFIISSSDAKLERAKALGAHHIINYSRTPGWGKIASELTGGRR